MTTTKEGTRIAGKRNCPRELKDLLKSLDVWDSAEVDYWVADHNKGKDSKHRFWIDKAGRRQLKQFHQELFGERSKNNNAKENVDDPLAYEAQLPPLGPNTVRLDPQWMTSNDPSPLVALGTFRIGIPSAASTGDVKATASATSMSNSKAEAGVEVSQEYRARLAVGPNWFKIGPQSITSTGAPPAVIGAVSPGMPSMMSASKGATQSTASSAAGKKSSGSSKTAEASGVPQLPPKGASNVDQISWFNALAQALVYSDCFTDLVDDHFELNTNNCNEDGVFKGVHDYLLHTKLANKYPPLSFVETAKAMEAVGIVTTITIVKSADLPPVLHRLIVYLDRLLDIHPTPGALTHSRPFQDVFRWISQVAHTCHHCTGGGFSTQQSTGWKAVMTSEFVSAFSVNDFDIPTLTTESLLSKIFLPSDTLFCCGRTRTTDNRFYLPRVINLSFTYPEVEADKGSPFQLSLSSSIGVCGLKYNLISAILDHQPIEPNNTVHTSTIVPTGDTLYHVSDHEVECMTGPVDLKKLQLPLYQQPTVSIAFYQRE